MTRNPHGRLEYAFQFAKCCEVNEVRPEFLQELTALVIDYYRTSILISGGRRGMKKMPKVHGDIEEKAARMGWKVDFGAGHWPIFRRPGPNGSLIVLPMP